jgi:chorismate mutase
MRLHALRGAISVEANTSEEILGATETLMREILERNALTPADVVSCLFTMTEDLDAQFPADAARAIGFDQVPLMCAREIPVPGSLPRVIRLLMHYYAPAEQAAKHVYLGEARALRADLDSAQ